MISRPPGLSFSRSARLKQTRDFARVKRGGQRIVAGSLIANWMVLTGPGASRLGVVTPRIIGPAVTRSRARRLLREVFRINQHKLKQPLDLVLVARKSIAGKKIFAVEADFLRALRQGQLVD